MACEKPIEPERIPDADNVARGIVIESERNVEVDLLGSVHMIHRARAIMQSPRPGKLEIGLHTTTSDCDRAGRQRHADYNRQIDLPRYRADLPLERRGHVRKSRIAGPLNVREIGWQVDQ